MSETKSVIIVRTCNENGGDKISLTYIPQNRRWIERTRRIMNDRPSKRTTGKRKNVDHNAR